MNVNLKNPNTNQVKQAKIGYSWTTLFFGFFPALFRGDWKWFAIIALTGIIVGAPCSVVGSMAVYIVYSFIYNKLYIKELLNKGFVAMDDASQDILVSNGIIIPNNN
ncbi:DUF2628 domain-containing protein [Weissella kandleri]|uniref:DUF2628 domain-containing protein n=1 Tax=Weissella kandleri TaxID=1616 RepID=UPI00387E6642